MTGILGQILQFFTLSHIMVIIYILNVLIALGLIFFDDSKSPSATMAWIMVPETHSYMTGLSQRISNFEKAAESISRLLTEIL